MNKYNFRYWNDNIQSGFQHFMRSLSTKVTKTYDIDITLIWMQMHVILFNVVRIFTVRNC